MTEEIVQDSVFFRAFEPEDYILINRWRNDPEIQKLTAGTFRYVSSEMEKGWVQSKMLNNTKDIYLAICLQECPQVMIGYTSINDIDYIHRSAHGGGVVIGDPEFRDGAIRLEVGSKIRQYVFETLNMHRFSGACLADHLTSRITIEASGFVLEGCKREVIFKNGKYHDLLIYSLLRDEYYQLLEQGAYNYINFARKVRELKKKYKPGVARNE